MIHVMDMHFEGAHAFQTKGLTLEGTKPTMAMAPSTSKWWKVFKECCCRVIAQLHTI
jgi:hypothetical protein